MLCISHPVPKASYSAPAKPHTPIHSRQPLSLCLGWALGGNPIESKWREGEDWIGLDVWRGRLVLSDRSREGFCCFWCEMVAASSLDVYSIIHLSLSCYSVRGLVRSQALSYTAHLWEFSGCLITWAASMHLYLCVFIWHHCASDRLCPALHHPWMCVYVSIQIWVNIHTFTCTVSIDTVTVVYVWLCKGVWVS